MTPSVSGANGGEGKGNDFPSLIGQFKEVMDTDTDTASMVESLLPRTTRKPDMAPGLEDVQILTAQILGKDTFQSSAAPEPIPGGFLIRGVLSPKLRKSNRIASSKPEVSEGKGGGTPNLSNTGGDELISTIDSSIDAIDPTWNERFQVSYIYDPTPKALEEGGSDEPVLIITGRNFTPSYNQILSTTVTTVSFFVALIFAVSTFGANDIVMDRLTTANEIARGGGADAAAARDLSWFNSLLSPLLLAIGLPQLAHELSHLAIAKRDNFKTTAPTVLPSIALPYLSFRTSLKTSPPNPTSLFDYAFAGPAAGMITSAALFTLGLQLTLAMSPSELALAPSVPVSFLRLSSLFGTAVDYALSGGSSGFGLDFAAGPILSQDPSVAVPLHPFAIGGAASFLVQALDAVPIGGGTDGGRMSQGLLGRKEHVGFGAVLYAGLFVWVILGGRTEIWLGYLFVMGIVQKDASEVMCRNEVDKAGLGRATGALIMWSLAILALTPVG